ncbi:MAG: efflux RND transporter permease subunit [Rhodovibrio sp.]|nr:efflux RND transporter permease subunit [Rhodovibrio sp.]
MRFTDIFIKRPVLATVVSLLILALGLRAIGLLDLREYPATENATVTVTTAYPGASADLVKGFITTPIERAIASANGIDYVTSTSIQGASTVAAKLRLNYDPNEALTQISSQVDKIRSELPERAQDPSINLSVGESTAAMYMAFSSSEMAGNQITNYLKREVQPKLETVPGIEAANVLGGRTFAMRIWLKPDRMAALDVTPAEVRRVLADNNYLAGVGNTKGPMVRVSLTAGTDLRDPDEFKQLVLKERDGTVVRLSDVADVQLGATNYDSGVKYDGKTATFIGLNVQPGANPLTVIGAVKDRFPEIKEGFPATLKGEIAYDSTVYIEDSIKEVMKTLGEAIAIVVVVIFLFLGSVRTVAIPVIAIPLSLVGAFFLMWAMGFSLNLLTLLAMVLAIGLVVDDAIIVTENIHRHVEEGLKPYDAAIKGARELATPVLAMTGTLVAVFAPIGFMGGLTGSLFQEFVFALAGAVVISGIVALTLSPMLCSKILRSGAGKRGFAHALDVVFEKLKQAYSKVLHVALNARVVIVLFGFAVLGSCFYMYSNLPSKLAPKEDQGLIIAKSTGAPNASIDQFRMWTDEVVPILQSFEATGHIFQMNGMLGPSSGASAMPSNTGIAGLNMKPWSERDITAMELKSKVQGALAEIPGIRTAAFVPPPLPGSGGGLPIQFVVGSIEEPARIYEFSQQLTAIALKSPLFAFAQSDLKFDRPSVNVEIDRTKARAMGIDMAELGRTLAGMLGANDVNRFALQGRSYEVIPQAERAARINPQQLLDYKVRTGSGELVALSTVVSLEKRPRPRKLNRFQQLNAATISAIPAPGVSMGEALSFLRSEADKILPPSYTVGYKGDSRQYVQEGQSLAYTFGFALLTIYLVLAAQFESFRDPLIMLISVPMSVAGALFAMTWAGVSLNIYTQIGMVTLIGLITKHGILIVEFANQLQREGYSKRAAIEEAAGIRLRPILMTTAATVVGVAPLIYAVGPGAVSRFQMGLVIASGIGIGTIFTLFVLPAFYTYLARRHEPEAETAEAVPAA